MKTRADQPAPELLRAARAGVLPADVQARIEHRLSTDEWSRSLADSLEQTEPSFDGNDEDRLLARVLADANAARDAPVSSSRLPRWIALAAAAAVVAAIGLFAWRGQSRTPRPNTTSAAAAPTSPAPTARGFRLPLDKPTVRLSMAALTWRGADSRNHLLSDLKPGMDAFRSGDYAAANRELSVLDAKYPDSVDVHYYQGVSRLFTGDATGAVESLRIADRAADPTLSDDVSWYLSIALERTGRRA